ncbi:excalibur calcium-binding domain-containing protein [Spirillospora sp. NPDC127200]
MALPLLLALTGCESVPAGAEAKGRASAPATVAVPDYTGQVLKEAKRAADRAGFKTDSHDATAGDSSQWADGNWQVCFQKPVAGTRAVPSATTIDFAVVRRGGPCPRADGQTPVPPKVPNVVGRSFKAASVLLRRVGITRITAASAYTDVRVPAAPEAWKVCFQDPEAGEEIIGLTAVEATLTLVRGGARCPATPYGELRRKPAAKPRRDRGTGSGDDGSGGSAYYPNCAAARAAGAAPLRRGDPGYSRKLDRDGDGVACE